MTVLWIILDNSIAFSLLFAGVWLVKALFRKQLSARMHYLVWAAVLTILLIPVRIENGIDLWSLLPEQTVASLAPQAEHMQPTGETIIGSNNQGNSTQASNSTGNNTPITQGQTQQAQPSQAHPRQSAHIDLPTVLLAIWLAGIGVSLLWQILGGRRLRRQILRSGVSHTPAWLADCAKDCARTLHLQQSVRIVLQPVLPMPAVMGVFRPLLAMPEAAVQDGNKERVRHILMHEFSHVRRGDLIAIALLNLLSAVYWFNPLTWLCFSLIRADMETSCDTDVLSALGTGQRQDYIRTLIHFTGKGRRTQAQVALSLHDARIKIKKRIGGMFMTSKTKPSVAVLVVLLVIVLMVAASATGCLPVSASLASPSAPAPSESAAPSPSAANTADPSATNAPDGETAAETSLQTARLPVAETKAPVSTASQQETLYQPVLEQYRSFTKGLSQNKGDGSVSGLGEPWQSIAPDIMLNPGKFGYAFRDMDSNGTPELFLLTSDGTIWAMYTVANGSPKLLAAYWSRNSCMLDRSDMIYTAWSNGALDNGRDAFRLSKESQSLELVKRVAMESTDESGKPLEEPRYYKCVGSESNKSIISQAEANSETSTFPNGSTLSGLTFIPLG